MRLSFAMPAVALALSFSLFAASDAEIQAAIDRGESQPNVEKLFRQIEKQRTLKINRQGFGETVGKKAVMVTDLDYVSILSCEAHRRHMPVTVAGVKTALIRGVPIMGITRIMFKVEANGTYADALPNWEAPGVHMILTADGREIQPLTESDARNSRTTWGTTEHGVVTNNSGFLNYTPLYTTSLYDESRSHTWFLFRLPPDAAQYSLTVIAADGSQKQKAFSAELLR